MAIPHQQQQAIELKKSPINVLAKIAWGLKLGPEITSTVKETFNRHPSNLDIQGDGANTILKNGLLQWQKEIKSGRASPTNNLKQFKSDFEVREAGFIHFDGQLLANANGVTNKLEDRHPELGLSKSNYEGLINTYMSQGLLQGKTFVSILSYGSNMIMDEDNTPYSFHAGDHKIFIEKLNDNELMIYSCIKDIKVKVGSDNLITIPGTYYFQFKIQDANFYLVKATASNDALAQLAQGLGKTSDNTIKALGIKGTWTNDSDLKIQLSHQPTCNAQEMTTALNKLKIKAEQTERFVDIQKITEFTDNQEYNEEISNFLTDAEKISSTKKNDLLPGVIIARYENKLEENYLELLSKYLTTFSTEMIKLHTTLQTQGFLKKSFSEYLDEVQNSNKNFQIMKQLKSIIDDLNSPKISTAEDFFAKFKQLEKNILIFLVQNKNQIPTSLANTYNGLRYIVMNKFKLGIPTVVGLIEKAKFASEAPATPSPRSSSSSSATPTLAQLVAHERSKIKPTTSATPTIPANTNNASTIVVPTTATTPLTINQ